jgi:hypothetical protein
LGSRGPFPAIVPILRKPVMALGGFGGEFTSLSAAASYFTDGAIDLGSLASGPLSNNILSVEAMLTVTTTSANSGFYGNLIVGDPPASGDSLKLINTMAAMDDGAGSGSAVPSSGSNFGAATGTELATPYHRLAA